jgi:transcriptional regulator with XRE-family HTH domain
MKVIFLFIDWPSDCRASRGAFRMEFDPVQPQLGKMVGMRLREARKARNFTQSQLAGNDFSVSYISAIERGQINPSLRAMEIFAQRLGLSSKDLLVPSTSLEQGQTRSGTTTTDEDETNWNLLLAHVLLFKGASEHAAQLLQQQLQKPLPAARKVYALYLLALAYARGGLWQESDHTLSEATRLIKDHTSPLALRLLFLQGLVQSQAHNPALALSLHQRSRTLLEAQQPQNIIFKAEVYAQLGYHLLQLEQTEEARTLLEAALQQIEATTPAELAAMYYELSRVDTQEHLENELAAYKSLSISMRLARQEQHRELHHLLGRALLHGEREQALAYLTGALNELPRDPVVQASAHIHLAMWELAAQNLAAARNHVKQAQALFNVGSDSIIAADIHFVSGNVEYAQRRYKAGDSHFEVGLAMLERLNESEYLADQYAHYAGLLEGKGDLSRAAQYWKKAYETRNKLRS